MTLLDLRDARPVGPPSAAEAVVEAVAEEVAETWTPVVHYEDLQPERGVAALLDGVQVAIFRTSDEKLYAIDNVDPFTGVAVLSRGIVGSRGDAPTVASPLHKQVFDLRTGDCFDEPGTTVATYAVRRWREWVEVAVTGPVAQVTGDLGVTESTGEAARQARTLG